MTQKEWLKIGYDSNLIDGEDVSDVLFRDAFHEWFLMKMKIVKPDTLDRIECTWNRYYRGTSFADMPLSRIYEKDIIDFLTATILSNPDMNLKEYKRLMQIVNNTLVYFKDIQKGGTRLYDWDRIKRYIPLDKLDKQTKVEFAVKESDIRTLLSAVLEKNVYPEKRNACLCLCMNFYLGLRIGELAALTFQDFDFDRGVVRIYKTQSKSFNRSENGERLGTMVYRVVEDVKTVYSVREIPILPEVHYIYSLIVGNHINRGYRSDYLAFDGQDVVLCQSLDHALRKLCALCEVPYFNSHVIRKTFATKLHFSGVPTRVISDLMGHSEIGTTENSYILSYNNNYGHILDYMKTGLDYKGDIKDAI